MAACQVVPDLATFAVDDGFTYRVPDGMDVSVGSRVRIRVSGRRRRGWVTAMLPDDPSRDLLPIDGVVGTVPSFDEGGLEVLRWAATHYVSPLSTILGRTVPPNSPKGTRPSGPGADRPGFGVSVVIGGSPHGQRILDMLDGRHGSALVIVPTTVETEEIAAVLRAALGDRVTVAHSGMKAAAVTSAWSRAATEPGTVLVATRETALWPVASLTCIIVVEDSRRVMKSPSTPTLGVREIALQRARRAAIPITFVTPLPSLETLTQRPSIDGGSGREWGLIETADRREEPPSSRPLLERTTRAIGGTVAAGGTAFVLVNRRGYAVAFRCTQCGTLRRCHTCDGLVPLDGTCLRCGAVHDECVECGGSRWQGLGAGIGSVVEDLRRSLGDAVGTADDDRPVTVGTERDLVGRAGLSLAVAVDADSLALAPNYRAGEDSLRLMVRLANTVGRGRGHRTIIQTSDPSHRVLAALRSGRHAPFMRDEARQRRGAGFPPFGELIAIEVAEADASGSIGELADVASVFGPAQVSGRQRWLIQGEDLTAARLRLRPMVRSLRDAGARVRVDVDPIDL